MMNIADVSSINDAMRMRDIRFGGKNAGKMIELKRLPILEDKGNLSFKI